MDWGKFDKYVILLVSLFATFCMICSAICFLGAIEIFAKIDTIIGATLATFVLAQIATWLLLMEINIILTKILKKLND